MPATSCAPDHNWNEFASKLKTVQMLATIQNETFARVFHFLGINLIEIVYQWFLEDEEREKLLLLVF